MQVSHGYPTLCIQALTQTHTRSWGRASLTADVMSASWTLISLNYTWCVTEKVEGGGAAERQKKIWMRRFKNRKREKWSMWSRKVEQRTREVKGGKGEDERKKRGEQDRCRMNRTDRMMKVNWGGRNGGGQCVSFLTCFSCSTSDLTSPANMRAACWVRSPPRLWTHTHTIHTNTCFNVQALS